MLLPNIFLQAFPDFCRLSNVPYADSLPTGLPKAPSCQLDAATTHRSSLDIIRARNHDILLPVNITRSNFIQNARVSHTGNIPHTSSEKNTQMNETATHPVKNCDE